MKILLVEPGKRPAEKEISGSLDSMQELVGGLIQAIYPFDDSVALICNDEGKLMNLPLNRYLSECQDVICGSFAVVGAPADSDSFASLTPEQLDRYQKRFQAPELFFLTDCGLAVIADHS